VPLGEGDRALALVLALDDASACAALALATEAGLAPCGLVPALVAGASAELERGAGATLVVDLLDDGALTLSAVDRGRLLILRTLPWSAADLAGAVEEARRTIGFVRERHHGLAIAEIRLRGPAEATSELAAALARDGLRAAAAPGPASLAASLLDPLAPGLEGLDALPREVRARALLRGVRAASGLAGVAAAALLAHASVAAVVSRRALESPGAAAAEEEPGLEDWAGRMAALRGRAAEARTLLEAARGPRSAEPARLAAAALARMPEELRLASLTADRDGLVVEGFAISARADRETPLERLARELSEDLDLPEPSLRVEPGLDDLSRLGGLGGARAETFELRLGGAAR
jgi:hypothetical protein